MKFVTIFALLLTSVSAFVPSTFMGGNQFNTLSTVNSNTMRMSVSDMIGIDTETKGLFDPLGFSKDEASLFRRRAVELKHGRICMLACLGTLVQSFYHLPDPVFNNPRPIGALLQVAQERPLALLQIVGFLAFIELGPGKQDYDNKARGELGRFGEAFKPDTEEELAALQLKELKNGRLAMMAIMGQLIQEGLTKQGPIEQLLVGHISPFGDGQGFF